MLRRLFHPAPEPEPASAEALGEVARALREAGLPPDVACAGFLFASRDERRVAPLLRDLAARRR